jgi:hypothetical protein
MKTQPDTIPAAANPTAVAGPPSELASPAAQQITKDSAAAIVRDSAAAAIESRAKTPSGLGTPGSCALTMFSVATTGLIVIDAIEIASPRLSRFPTKSVSAQGSFSAYYFG